ncbi:MAG: cytidylate kinase-like family protein [Mogibacterium sp.]|nr:cytidylate kinase-like family protein [Mogibacterium sp.]
MADKIIVTIDREFGSGGHEVGKRLAERLGIKFFDEEIIARAAASTGYHEEYIRDNDEKAPDYSVASLFTGFDSFQVSPYTKIQEEEFRIIKEIAAEDSCVIVGRAADYILRDERHVSIFIFAPLEDRVRRRVALSVLKTPEEIIDENAIEKEVKQIDKQRRRYYEFYTDNKWGGRDVYDLLINTNRAGIDGAVDIIEAYIKGGKGLDIQSDIRDTMEKNK